LNEDWGTWAKRNSPKCCFEQGLGDLASGWYLQVLL
jgi:hypothetical protein